MLIGKVVAEVDRPTTCERRAPQQFQHGAALVHAGRLELQHQVAWLQFVTGQLFHQGGRCFMQRRQLRWRASAMQGDRHLLILQLHAVEASGQRLRGIAHARLVRGGDCEVPAIAIGIAQLQSMQSGGSPARGVEQAIEIRQLAATDQRQRTIERLVQRVQKRQQRGAGADRKRIIGEIQQGAVDVEEDRPTRAGIGQGRRRQRVAGCAGNSRNGR